MRKRTIREWLAYKEFSKQHVANLLGVHGSTFDAWMRQPDKMKIRHAVKLAEIFDCDVGDIIFFEDKPNLLLGMAQ